MTDAVVATSVCVRFGATVVLDDLSLSIAEGATHAIVGPSGTGKSTLLAVIGLLLVPQRGDLELLGRPVPSSESQRSRLRRLAIRWVPQLPQLLPGRSALANVAAAAEIAGQDPVVARANATLSLEQVGLGHRASTKATRLSGGEQQRVSVARALVSDAPLILADEPTASLDRESARGVVTALIAPRRTARTVVVATHDLELAKRCDALTDLRGVMEDPST